MILNSDEWCELIKRPDWYKFVNKKLQELQKLKSTEPELYEQEKEKIYDFFQKHLESKNIFLGTTGKNWDLERKPVDTVVIHHTSNKPGISKERLSAIELFRLYSSVYADSKSGEDPEVYNKPVYSGHFRNGRQMFWAYHWLIRSDGSQERLLLDQEIGWQSGNWNINCRSIAIVFDNDFENSRPGNLELESAAALIRLKYCLVPKNRIFGHREVNSSTVCPSNKFLPTQNSIGWKEELLALIYK
ncbi:MAG TPA: peptidoglycan recognition family protein [Patescibacteria group bacterium]|nr:peptidoglycan recognition family protein [Patescibacteria group bacterium]